MTTHTPPRPSEGLQVISLEAEVICINAEGQMTLAVKGAAWPCNVLRVQMPEGAHLRQRYVVVLSPIEGGTHE